MNDQFPGAPQAYSQADESSFRAMLGRTLAFFIRSDKTNDRLLFKDRDTGEIVALTVESGVPVVTAL